MKIGDGGWGLRVGVACRVIVILHAFLAFELAVIGGTATAQTAEAADGAPFTDDPLVAGVTPVRAVHFEELRRRIDALRARAGLPAFAWTDAVLTPGVTPVRRVHVTELRAALDAAYAAARRSSPTWDDGVVTAGATPIRARHVTELRAAVVALETAPNRAPEAVGAVPARTLAVGGGTQAVDVAPYFDDPDVDPLNYEATSSDTGVVTAGVSGSTVTLAPVSVGAATVTVTARDEGGLSASQAVSVTVLGPDLVVESPGASDAAVKTGASFRLWLTVVNRGEGASGPTTLRFYRSSDSTISASDTEVGAAAVSGLPAGSREFAAVGVTAPGSAGTYYYGGCVAAVGGESETGNNCSSGVRVTVEPRPDLVVASPGVSDAVVKTGASFTLSLTVLNRGEGVAGSTTLRYYRSSDPTISASDTEVGAAAVSGLAGGANEAASVRLTAPASAGTYYYGGCVAAVGEESETGNNCSSGVRVTVESRPDLVVASPGVSDAVVKTGASFTLSLTVLNRGEGAAGPTTLRYYRSRDSAVSASDTELGVAVVSGLTAGSSEFASVSVTAPDSGTYYYGGCVEPVEGERETDNNCSSGVLVTVESRPDLVVEPPGVSDAAVRTGASFTLSLTVVNRGEGASGTTTLRYYRSPDSTISASDTEVGAAAVSGLSAGSRELASVSVTAPGSAGTYYYGGCVAAVGGESETGNNCSPGVPVTVEPRPDLVVASPGVSDGAVRTGASFTLSLTVLNRGEGDSGTTTLRYYRSLDPTISASDTEVGAVRVPGLSAGASEVASVGLTAPDSAGTYHYGGCVESVDGERDTGNNCSSGVLVTVESRPDLVAESPGVSAATVKTGAPFTMSLTVVNRGEGVAGSTRLRYYRSPDSTISAGDAEVGAAPVSGLPAGSREVLSVSLTAPDSPGTYHYGGCVAAVDGERETGNNCSSGARVTVEALPPDLVVEFSWASGATVEDPVETVDAGASFMLSQTVVNRGEGASTTTVLRSYRSPDPTISADDTLVGVAPVSGLAAGASALASVVVTASDSAGTYYYGGCVEAVGGESDTGNNCSAGVPVTVESSSPPPLPPPPRRPDDVELTFEECRGRLVEVNGETVIAATMRFTLHARRHVGEVSFEAYVRDRVSGEKLNIFIDADLEVYYGWRWVGELRAGQSSQHTEQGFVRLDDISRAQCVVDYEWDPQPPPPPPPRPSYPPRYEVTWDECNLVVDEARGETAVTVRLTFRALLNVRRLSFVVFFADGLYHPDVHLEPHRYQWVGDLAAGDTYTYEASGYVRSTSPTLACRVLPSALNT